MGLRKPRWLKKAHEDKPWLYDATISTPGGKVLTIQEYNFEIDLHRMKAKDVRDAIEWIDEKQSQEDELDE